ncbi:MAG TPA: SpoIIE family protein phosphatase [Blastocatellia bacterium]|nr:SpoIIE family protein phosphatase [Blastocatellia bacterium]
MLLGKISSQKIRWSWIALLVLSPMAYIAGLTLFLRHDPNARVGIGIDRNLAISIATQVAAGQGLDVRGWDQYCHFKAENNLLFYYRLQSGAERDLARRLAPEATIGVLLRSPDRKEIIEIWLGPDGRFLGSERKLSKSIEYLDPGEEAAKKVAREAILARLRTAGLSGPVELGPGEIAGEGKQVRKYVWNWPLTTLPGLKFQSVVYVRGGVLTGDLIKAEVDEGFARSRLHTHSASHIISTVIYGLVIVIVVIFGIYRFVQRAGQKEISYSRILLLTLILAAFISSFILLSDMVMYGVAGTPDFPLPDAAILLPAVMVYLLLAMFLGLAYGSGEGDIREAYPGKLASLDALLLGKLFSRNVARSVIAGYAIGGWILFGTNLASLPWLSRPEQGEELGPLDLWFGPIPWLSPFTIAPVDVILVTVVGLLIPLPLIHRRLRWRGLVTPLLAVFIWVACSGPYLGFRPQIALWAMAAVRTVMILLSFMMLDLLTVVVGLAAPTFISFAVALMAQPSASLHRSGVIALVLILIGISIELFFLFKGKLYDEAEVRPVYAKHLAERLSMQVEVSAAREAQKRLMPTDLPQTPYLSIAASCLPAFEVGGDFYDLFEIEPGKIGVLIAEGGGKGLASALSIAFAKGFLMPKIMGSRMSDNSPSEIIHSLQDRLMARIAVEEVTLGLAYAVIDARDGTLRYARTTDYPLILVQEAGASSPLAQPAERTLRFTSKLGAHEEICLIEGSCSLRPGDSVVLFTDGLAKDWADHGSSPAAELARVLDSSRPGPAEKLRENLAKAVDACSRRAKKRGLRDDLTAIVVRLEKNEEAGEI